MMADWDGKQSQIKVMGSRFVLAVLESDVEAYDEAVRDLFPKSAEGVTDLSLAVATVSQLAMDLARMVASAMGEEQAKAAIRQHLMLQRLEGDLGN